MTLTTNVHVDTCVLTHMCQTPVFRLVIVINTRQIRIRMYGACSLAAAQLSRTIILGPHSLREKGYTESRFKDKHVIGWGSCDGQNPRKGLGSQPKQTIAGNPVSGAQSSGADFD